jgi:hypothetical protein
MARSMRLREPIADKRAAGSTRACAKISLIKLRNIDLLDRYEIAPARTSSMRSLDSSRYRLAFARRFTVERIRTRALESN